MAKMGRPFKVEGERRRPVTISLGDSELEALRELSRIRGESQGAIVGRFLLQAIARERRKNKQ